MKTVFPYQEQSSFDAYLDKYLQREDAIRRIPGVAELKELARKGVVKDQLVLVPLPEGASAEPGDTLTLRTVSELPKFNRERVTVSIGRGLYDRGLEEALVGTKVGEGCEATVGIDLYKLSKEEMQERMHRDSLDDFVAMRYDWYKVKIHQCLIYLNMFGLPCEGKTDPLDHYKVLSELTEMMYGKIIEGLARRNAQ